MKKKASLQVTSQENKIRSLTQRKKALRDVNFQKGLRKDLSAYSLFMLLEYAFQNTQHVLQFP